MAKPFYLFIALLLAFLPGKAVGSSPQQQQKKQHTINLRGYVKDSFTKVNLKAFVTIMDADSTVLDTTTTRGWRNNIAYSVNIPPKTGKYIIKAECEGYDTDYLDYNIKYIARNKFFSLLDLPLRKKISREVELDGVTVTSTKVKFAYRGDTIVYNASAFNVPDGSMLDAIVRQMPGAEIKSNGDIYINGKKIDYLLLNGKDFFKGNNKIMLDNLPYYTVNDLKVYNRSSDKSRLMGKEVEKKDYVMDVGLKREYNRNYTVNAEAAGGTKDRYMARLFGLYFTDHTRLSVYGNINNVNEDRRPGYDGDWRPSNSPQGQKTTRQAGINYNVETKNGKLKNEGFVTVKFDELHDISRTATENFASAGNIFSRSTSDQTSKSHQIWYNSNLQLQGSTGFFFNPDIRYSDNSSKSASRSATYTAEPSGFGGIQQTLDSTFANNIHGHLHDIITNRSLNYGRTKTESFDAGYMLMAWHKLPWGDRIELESRFNYIHTKPSDAFSLSRNEYMKAGDNDLRNQYTDTHNNSYYYENILIYGLEIPNTVWTVKAGPMYKQEFKSYYNMNYRLDWLGGQWQDDPMSVFATLPSTEQQLNDALNTQTSRHYSTMQRRTGGRLEFLHNKNGLFMQFTLNAYKERENIYHHTASADTTATRSRFVVSPSIFIQRYSDKLFVYFNYNTINNYPDFASILPYTDDSNPLAIRVNNPKLKTPLIHHYDFNFRLSGLKNQQFLGFFATGNFYHNNCGTRTTYNSQTGGYTYMSDNVKSGNWDFWTTFSYGTALDKNRLFSLDSRLWFNGLKRTDFDIAYDNSDAPLYKMLTTELGTSQYVRLQKGNLTVSVGGKVEWRHSTSDRDNFTTINACDFEYGGTISCRLPLGISLATDIKEYCRRGYSEKSMNTSDLVWNASLTRSFCKGSLTLKAEAFDILGQLSNTQYDINAQTKNETWRNTIPSYAMMHLTYKFSKTPKKK